MILGPYELKWNCVLWDIILLLYGDYKGALLGPGASWVRVSGLLPIETADLKRVVASSM